MTQDEQNFVKNSVMVVSPGKPLIGESGQAGCPHLPGDKSLSHRAILFAAMADGISRIENLLVSGVTQAMLGALTALGVRWELLGTTCTIHGIGLGGSKGWQSDQPVGIDCGNSATTLRLLAGALAAWNGPAVLDGSAGLRRRPMGRIVEPLKQMGVDIRSENGCAPLTLNPSQLPLRAVEHFLPVASAQVKSCLMLAALAAEGPVVIHEPGPSRDHSERMMRSMGVRVETGVEERRSMGVRVETGVEAQDFLTTVWPAPAAGLRPLDGILPGDFSAAAFLIVAALITPGSHVVLRNVGLNPTRTGLLDALRSMGADIVITHQSQRSGEPAGDLTVRSSLLHGGQVSGDLVVRMIDEFPAFAVAAACAQGTTLVQDAAELRLKESDRISALCGELRKLGVQAIEHPDGFEIHGGRPFQGGEVDPHGDHRLAMSLALAGLVAQAPVRVLGAEIIGESFPEFPTLLQVLGASLQHQTRG